MATCRKKFNQVIKINKATGAVTPVGEPFDFAGTTVDPTTLTNCPDPKVVSDDVCITTDGVDCVEGVKRICQVIYDCVTEESSVEVLSFILPDNTEVKAADFAAPMSVIPCPSYEITSDTLCETPAA